MRLVVLAALAGFWGCYQAPVSDSACTMLCDDRCPDGLSCKNGFCVGDGETCEPELTRVSAGNGFACALDTSDRLWCWGANDHHQLEPSERTRILYASLIGRERWDAIATGGDHTCGLRGGELYCWGGNDRQQVSGGVAGDVVQPQRIATPTGAPWQAVATGFNQTCAIADQLYCWGAGELGQLGTGGTGDIGVPTPVASPLTDWTSVSIGRFHACAISASAGLHCWGYNYYGQVGDGAALYSPMPVLAPTPIALPNTTAVAVAGYSTCAIADGKLSCWGYHGASVLGDPALTDLCAGPRNTPQLATGLEGWTAVSAGLYMSCGLRDEEVWCWGSAIGGSSIGTGVWGVNGWARIAQGASAVSVGWSSNIDDTSDTSDLDLACIVVGGEVQCWGDNRFGQLGQGGATLHATPEEIAGGHSWATLLASDAHTCGITDGGELYCWGSTQTAATANVVTGTTQLPCGALPDLPCNLDRPTLVSFHPTADAIAVGDTHTCALLGSTLTCWGDNGLGQLGAADVMPPYTVPGAWSRVYSTGSSGQCAEQAGQTFCWGAVTNRGQPVTHDPRLDGMSWIFVNANIGDVGRAGGERTFGCLLDASSQLACFGVNLHGQFGTGPPAPGFCGDTVCGITETAATCALDCTGTQRCSIDACTGGQVCTTVFATCGDGKCAYGYGETCSSCAGDCGVCPLVPLARTYSAVAVNMLSTNAYACGVRPDQRIECWGRNTNGQLAQRDPATGRPPDHVYSPVEVAGLEGCTAVSAADTTTCAICGGELYCWGNHRLGGVGAGPTTGVPITTPRKLEVALDDGDRFVQLTAGLSYTCARSEQGRGFCWGFQRHGALGAAGSSANTPTTVKIAP